MPAAAQTPRFQELLKRLFGLKESRAFDVEDVILPVVDVLDPSAPEIALLRGELRVGASASSAAGGVGQFSFIAVENPIGSSVLIIIEAVTVQPLAGQQIYLGLAKSTGLGASAGAVKTPMDGRGFPASAPPLIGDVRTGNDATDPNIAGNGFGYYLSQTTSTGLPWPTPAVLPPGWSAVFKASSANQVLRMGLLWRIKFVDQTEIF